MAMIWKNMKIPPGSVGQGIQGSTKERLKEVDFMGASLLVMMLLSFMAVVSFSGKELKVGSSVFWFLIILMISTGAAFVHVELNVATQPVTPVKLLAYRTVQSSSLVSWFMSMAVFTYLFYIPVFWSSVMGLTPAEVGLSDTRLLTPYGAIVRKGIYVHRPSQD
jgi:hypothetical protein